MEANTTITITPNTINGVEVLLEFDTIIIFSGGLGVKYGVLTSPKLEGGGDMSSIVGSMGGRRLTGRRWVGSGEYGVLVGGAGIHSEPVHIYWPSGLRMGSSIMCR